MIFHPSRFTTTADYSRKDDVPVPIGSAIHQGDSRICGTSVPRRSPHRCLLIVGRVCFHRSAREKAASLRRQIKVSFIDFPFKTFCFSEYRIVIPLLCGFFIIFLRFINIFVARILLGLGEGFSTLRDEIINPCGTKM